MSKLHINPYGEFGLMGTDFPPMENQTLRKLVFSPDKEHSVAMAILNDGTLLLTHKEKIHFEISISRNSKVMAIIDYDPNAKELGINNIWRLTQKGVNNVQGSEHTSRINTSPHFNLDLREEGIGRVDIEVGDSGFACCVFTSQVLLFVRMNGHHVVPRLTNFIEAERQRSQLPIEQVVEANPVIRKKIGEKYFEEWANRHERGLK